MVHLTISSCGSAEGPPLPHRAPTPAPLPQELPQVREEGAPFPGLRPQGGRLHGPCSEEDVPLVYKSHSACTRCEQPPMAAITPGRKSRKVASSPGTVKCTCLPNHLESQPRGTGDHITKLGPCTWRPPGECGILLVLGRVYSCHVLACEGPRRGLEAEPRVEDDDRTFCWDFLSLCQH